MDAQHLTAEQHAEMRQSLIEAAPELQRDIDAKIAELRALLGELDIPDVLSPLTTLVYVRNSRQEKTPKPPEGEDDEKPVGDFGFAHIEYLLNVATAIEPPKAPRLATPADTQRVQDLVQQIFNAVMWFYTSSTAKMARDDPRQEARFHALATRLFVRADAYQSFLFDTARELFAPFNAALREKIGVDVDELLACINALGEQIQGNVDGEMAKAADLMGGLHNDFLKLLEGHGAGADYEAVVKEYRERPDTIEKFGQFTEQMRAIGGEPVYRIRLGGAVTERILEHLSTRLGQNEAFCTPPEFAFWPLNDSVLNSCPIIKRAEAYYCYLPSTLGWHLKEILEKIVRECGDGEWNRYLKVRREYYERKAVEYLEKATGSDRVYRNLYYPDEKGERAELDGLIVFDERIFLIEVKGGRFSSSARRGSVDRLKSDLEGLIQEPFDQARRARDHLERAAPAVFCDERGREVIRLEKGKDFKEILCITVTAECLGGFATYLKMTKALGLLPADENPWAVYIHDLRVISELMESPSEFMHFLTQRLRAGTFEQVHIIDELDYLGVYIKQGLYLEDWHLGENDHLSFDGYTKEIDRYYLSRPDEAIPKPRQAMPKRLRSLIAGLNRGRAKGFTRAAHHLLSVSDLGRKEIDRHLEMGEKKAGDEKRAVDFTLIFGDASRGVTLVVVPVGIDPDLPSLKRYVALKKYQMRFSEWLLMLVQDGAPIHFEILDEAWHRDPRLEQAAQRYAQSRVAQRLGVGKIGRNDLCPCHSGKKFKKCCG